MIKDVILDVPDSPGVIRLLLECNHYSNPVPREWDLKWDFPDDPVGCRVCDDDEVLMHSVLRARLWRAMWCDLMNTYGQALAQERAER